MFTIVNDKEKCYPRRPSHETGFSLLEVLVAVLVFAIGLAGLAALNVNGVRNVHSAFQASLASSVALDFEERLWLALADLNSGCADAGDVAGDLEGQWGGGFVPVSGWGAPMRLPGLKVDVLEVSEGSVEFRVSWIEERLLGPGIGTDPQRETEFVYQVDVLCR